MEDQLSKSEYQYVKALREDFTLAARELLCSAPNTPLELWWGQQIAISAMKSKRITFTICGRGLGKTFNLATFGTLKALLYPRHKVGITSASFRQSKFVFAEIIKMFEYSPFLRASARKKPTIGADICHFPLNNDSSITALPLGDGEKIRGARFHTLLVDEAVKIPEEILQVSIMPMLNVKKDPMIAVEREKLRQKALEQGEVLDIEEDFNQIVFSTTAWFQYSFLYGVLSETREYIEECEKLGIEPDKAIVEFGYKDAPKGFLDIGHIEMTKRTMNPIWFAMENLAYWPPDTDGFYPVSIMEQCKDSSVTPIMKARKGKRYAVAIDPARESDNFIMMVAEIEQSYSKLVYVKVLNKSSFVTTNGFREMHHEIRRVILNFDPEMVAMDAGGGGISLRDMLSEEYEFVLEDGTKIIMPPYFQIEGQRKEHDNIRDPSAERKLDLVHFSVEFVNHSSFNLRKMFEGQSIRFATNPLNITKDEEEELDKQHNILVSRRDILATEVEEIIQECSNIVATELPSKKGFFRFDTPENKMKKDRWAALILMAHAINKIQSKREHDLPGGSKKYEEELLTANTNLIDTNVYLRNSPTKIGVLEDKSNLERAFGDIRADYDAAALARDK